MYLAITKSIACILVLVRMDRFDLSTWQIVHRLNSV